MTVFLRPASDVALDGWTDQADGTSNIFAALDEASAGDSDFVQSPSISGGGGGGAVESAWTASGPTPTTGGTSIDYGTLAIGAADADRVIAVFIANRNTSVACYPSSVTVGGVSLTAFGASGGTNQETSGQFWYGSVPTGTTANVSATFSETIVRSMIQVYRIITSAVTPSVGTSVADLYHSANPAVASITVPTDGKVIAGTYWRNPVNLAGLTWTNATEDSDVTLDSVSICGSATVNGTGTVVVSVFVPSSTGDDVILSMIGWEGGGGPATTDLKVRLFDGATQIAEWTHTDVAETFATAEQTLTAPQVAAITDFSNLFAELDDNQGNVYRFALGDPVGGVIPPVKVRYRYKKLVA